MARRRVKILDSNGKETGVGGWFMGILNKEEVVVVYEKDFGSICFASCDRVQFCTPGEDMDLI